MCNLCFLLIPHNIIFVTKPTDQKLLAHLCLLQTTHTESPATAAPVEREKDESLSSTQWKKFTLEMNTRTAARAQNGRGDMEVLTPPSLVCVWCQCVWVEDTWCISAISRTAVHFAPSSDLSQMSFTLLSLCSIKINFLNFFKTT